MIRDLKTEQRNQHTMHIDTMDTLTMVQTINSEDQKVAAAVGRTAPVIAQVIDATAARFQADGRLFYCGAGTSGRLGVLDAAELVPTYGIDPQRAVGLIAGGQEAMFNAVEGAEDDATLGQTDLAAQQLTQQDVVIGIAASGRTPYVKGALRFAHEVGALTVAVACVAGSEIGQLADFAVEAEVGPEVVTGSTRMKAGTAQKMILNTISTGVMIRVGKVFQNLMVDVRPTNTKLVDRAQRIIMDATGVELAVAQSVLTAAQQDVPVAIVMARTGLERQQASQLLAAHHGVISRVLSQWSDDNDQDK